MVRSCVVGIDGACEESVFGEIEIFRRVKSHNAVCATDCLQILEESALAGFTHTPCMQIMRSFMYRLVLREYVARA